MTRTQFMGQFDRLCKGFRYDSTQEQSEAWFRKIGHGEVADWAEAVTTLLCAPRFPILDPVLKAIDEARDNRQRSAVHRDQPRAQSMLDRLSAGEGTKQSPTLWKAIKAFGARDQVREYLSMVRNGRVCSSLSLREAALVKEDERLTAELMVLMPKLDEAELSEFMERYGAAVAA